MHQEIPQALDVIYFSHLKEIYDTSRPLPNNKQGTHRRILDLSIKKITLNRHLLAKISDERLKGGRKLTLLRHSFGDPFQI